MQACLFMMSLWYYILIKQNLLVYVIKEVIIRGSYVTYWKKSFHNQMCQNAYLHTRMHTNILTKSRFSSNAVTLYIIPHFFQVPVLTGGPLESVFLSSSQESLHSVTPLQNLFSRIFLTEVRS